MPLNDPLGSTAVDVFAFNVAKEDEFVNSSEDFYIDRFNNPRYTAQGLATLGGGGTIVVSFSHRVAALGTDINTSDGTILYKVITSNTAFTESLVIGDALTLVINPSTYSVTWPSSFQWLGSTPTLDASSNNVIRLFKYQAGVVAEYVGSFNPSI